jgi:hypothetical protein
MTDNEFPTHIPEEKPSRKPNQGLAEGNPKKGNPY